MMDGPDHSGRKSRDGSDGADATVATLASQALAVLASKRSGERPLNSERLLMQLVNASCKGNEMAVAGAVTDLRHSGISDRDIVDHYIPETARRLGEGWLQDTLGFVDVTIGAARLHSALRSVVQTSRDRPTESGRQSVLLIVPEGETHTLGAMVASDQIRREGVSVKVLIGEAPNAVLRTVAKGTFAAVFLSVGFSDRLADVRNLVKKIRHAMPDPVPILVGGAVAEGGSAVMKEIGADFVATDPREALRLCGLTAATQVQEPCEVED